MLKMGHNLVGVENGEQVMFSDFEHDGEMWKGKGQRQSRRAVAFSEPFSRIPVVQVSMSMWDIDKHSNMRGDLQAENVTTTGFELVFRTWSDSRVARIRASWLAIGPLEHQDDWELY
ncbi:H-type lectin domain-containing protein [Halocynthiibacter namhaensis]|uniref:H-type lectin domain-containing protein n=1 Tax=Halocynthiibacter namhaensis TaxID=1290553 RepID=UPI00057918F1|nr:H-type lectin domain-containing protein [Halocynthiibacter namhaensis]